MMKGYRYRDERLPLQYYSEPYDNVALSVAGQPPTQPPLFRDLNPIQREDTLTFAEGVPDIRGFAVNTPDGDTLGTVEGFLADTAHHTLPYLYISFEGRTVVAPTDQAMIYPDQCLLTLEGGKSVLNGAPIAQFDAVDAEQAERYWRDYRRRNAA